jgi:hypothetical protein
MKQIIVAAVLALSTTAALAGNHGEPSIQKIDVNTTYQRLIIKGDVDVVITSNDQPGVRVEGDAEVVKTVQVTNSNGALEVTSLQAGKKAKLVVYVPESQLHTIEINGNGLVGSDHTMQVKSLDVVVNGACTLKLKAKAPISISESSEYEFNLQTYSSSANKKDSWGTDDE